MPQWDFLNFLAEHGRRYPTYKLCMHAEVTDLIEEGGRIVGVRATTPDGPLSVRSTLVIGADGRGSIVRERAGLKVEDLGAPIDVLWMRLSRRPSDGAEPLGRIGAGKILVMIDRGDYWQCAYVIAKGAAEEIKAQGLEAFRAAIVAVAPQMHDRVQELRSWDDVKLLTVKVDRLAQWHRPGLLCIGDAAHAMSPVGGVGINLAIQDAVAAANRLAAPLRAGTVSDDGSRGGAATPHVPDAGDAANPGFHSEQRLEPRAGEPRRAEATMAGAAARPVPVVAAHSGPAGRPWRAARACANAGGRTGSARLTSRLPVGAIRNMISANLRKQTGEFAC